MNQYLRNLLFIILALAGANWLIILLHFKKRIDIYGSHEALSLTTDGRYAGSDWLTVLYWTVFSAEPRNNWSIGLRSIGCPEPRCHFTYERKHFEKADFVFVAQQFQNDGLPSKKGHPGQQWVYSIFEPPHFWLDDFQYSDFFEWIQSYHTKDDVPGSMGYLVPLNRTWPDDTNLMDPMSEVYLSYMKALNEGKSLHDLIDTVPPANRERLVKLIGTFESKSKLGAIMTSNCKIVSERLSVIKKLNHQLGNNPIDVYGKCGHLKCRERRYAVDPWCWQNLLSPNYFFYFSMENSLCEQYITEKLYNPLFYGMVPVVYGGANYSLYLPPHSFIDVQEHTPQQLADLLLRIREDKAEYSRYHLWRAFWEPVVGVNMCAVCKALHRLNGTVARPQRNIWKKRIDQEPCHPPNSSNWFPM